MVKIVHFFYRISCTRNLREILFPKYNHASYLVLIYYTNPQIPIFLKKPEYKNLKIILIKAPTVGTPMQKDNLIIRKLNNINPHAIILGMSPKYAIINRLRCKNLYYIHHGFFDPFLNYLNFQAFNNWKKNSYRLNFICCDLFAYTNIKAVLMDDKHSKKLIKIDGLPQIDYLLNIKDSLIEKKQKFLIKNRLSTDTFIILIVCSRATNDIQTYRNLITILKGQNKNRKIHFILKFATEKDHIEIKKKLTMNGVSVILLQDLLYDYFFADLVIVHGWSTSYFESLLVNNNTLFFCDKLNCLEKTKVTDLIKLATAFNLTELLFLTKEHLEGRLKMNTQDQIQEFSKFFIGDDIKYVSDDIILRIKLALEISKHKMTYADRNKIIEIIKLKLKDVLEQKIENHILNNISQIDSLVKENNLSDLTPGIKSILSDNWPEEQSELKKNEAVIFENLTRNIIGHSIDKTKIVEKIICDIFDNLTQGFPTFILRKKIKDISTSDSENIFFREEAIEALLQETTSEISKQTQLFKNILILCIQDRDNSVPEEISLCPSIHEATISPEPLIIKKSQKTKKNIPPKEKKLLQKKRLKVKIMSNLRS